MFVSSYCDNLISKGTVTQPARVDAKTQAPYSGFDSERIATPSPFLISSVSIMYFAIFLENKPKPL